MTCPHYQGDQSKEPCKFKSQFYEFALGHIENHCKGDYYGCEIYQRAEDDEIKKTSGRLAESGLLRESMDSQAEAYRSSKPFLERVIIKWSKTFSKKAKEQDKRFFKSIVENRRIPPETMDEPVDI